MAKNNEKVFIKFCSSYSMLALALEELTRDKFIQVVSIANGGFLLIHSDENLKD